MYETLLKMPFFRFLIPFISGIIFQYYVNIPTILYVIIFITGLLFLITFHLFKNKYINRYLFGTGIYCLLFLFGGASVKQIYLDVQWNFPVNKQLYEIKLLDDLVDKKKNYQCIVDINSIKTDEKWKSVNKKAILYIAKDSVSQKLKAGNIIKASTSFNQVNFIKGSDFDYAVFLKNKSISCVGYVSSGNWKKSEEQQNPFPDLKITALNCRRFFLKKLESITHSEKEYGIAAGILFGYKSVLDNNLKNAFSTTGGAHVLVVSGLHVAILYSAIILLFSFLGNSRQIKYVRQPIALSLIWGFAFITGLTPSVVRATSMISIYGFSEIIGRKAFSLNTVFATAFLMLAYYPLYLFDVGFQLSFLAVTAIITLNPILQNFYKSRYRICNYLWSLTTVSTSAQIGTAPVSIFYFHQFPVVFLLTNLFVIPLVGVILIMLLIYLIITCMTDISGYLTYPLHYILLIFISGIESITKIPYNCIFNLYPDLQDIISLYLFIIFLTLLLIRKKIVFAYIIILLGLFQVIHYL